MKKILITNDDGIEADGIIRLARAAKKFGEVTVVAPCSECSAMAHKLTLREPIDVYEVLDFPVEGVKAYRLTGTPADCIRIGILNILKEKPDAVLSGINNGYNCGSDIQYSGTAAAAFEAASSGIHAIAVSEGADNVHEVCDAYLEEMLKEYLEKPLQYNYIWNINFPECPLEDYKGILLNREVAHNSFFTDSYSEEKLPDGGIRCLVNGEYKTDRAAEGTDFKACVDNYISVSAVSNVR